MTSISEKYFNKIYWWVCTLVFFIVALRAYFIPFAHDEVATFLFYIQPGKFIPFLSHPDANGHFLTNLTSFICFKLFGSSPFSLRIPSLIAFLVLCYAIFRMREFFKSTITFIVFSSAFILSFHFISFYSLCRGYGISMSFLVLALYYFFKYKQDFAFKHFIKSLLFSQIALSANVTLVFVLLAATAITTLWQLKQKLFFKPKNIIALLLHLAMILFWVKYAFYLKESGALYYGEGESYWKTTFVSLIETIAFKNQIIYIVVILLFAIMFVYWCFNAVQEKSNFIFYNNFSIAFTLLSGLILAFYLLKKILGVNYPEDRTGLFFYVFFVLSLGFMINEWKTNFQIAFIFTSFFFILHFILNINFKVHPWAIYETMPNRFFTILKEEQKKIPYPITVAGHRVYEFFYGFLNYNSDEKLSHMTAPEALQMNCDYALAYKKDKPYYNNYYSELAEENKWDFVLLKRKQAIERVLIAETSNLYFSGEQEFFNAIEFIDTTFHSQNPLLAEFEFSAEKVPTPFNSWLVLQIDGDTSDFVRTPLNLVKYDWNGTQHFKTCLVSANIPIKIKRLVAYLWNIDKKEIIIHLNSFKLYKLKGEGVTELSKTNL